MNMEDERGHDIVAGDRREQRMSNCVIDTNEVEERLTTVLTRRQKKTLNSEEGVR